MDEPGIERIRKGLLTAIQAEHDGYHFYLMASRATSDEQGREVFERLAEEELEHHRYLRQQYQAILETGSPDPAARLGQPAALIGQSPIFSPALRANVGQAHFEMSSLSIGIQLELSSMEHYRSEAEAAADMVVKTFYTELAEWERGHYQALLRQQELLREDYWAAGGFSPF